jgi:hypothetical protein
MKKYNAPDKGQGIYSKVKEFAKDYWDLGATLTAGFAFNDYNNAVLGQLRAPIMLLGTIGGLYGGKEGSVRMMRNLTGGLATFTCFWGYTSDAPLIGKAIFNGIPAAVFGSGMLYADNIRREEKNKKTHSTSSDITDKMLE